MNALLATILIVIVTLTLTAVLFFLVSGLMR